MYLYEKIGLVGHPIMLWDMKVSNALLSCRFPTSNQTAFPSNETLSYWMNALVLSLGCSNLCIFNHSIQNRTHKINGVWFRIFFWVSSWNAKSSFNSKIRLSFSSRNKHLMQWSYSVVESCGGGEQGPSPLCYFSMHLEGFSSTIYHEKTIQKWRSKTTNLKKFFDLHLLSLFIYFSFLFSFKFVFL